MNYEQTINQTKERMDPHCAQGGISPEKCREFLQKMTKTYPSADHLQLAGVRDLRELGMPDEMARDIILVWRGQEREKLKVIIDASPEAEAARLTVDELIEKYKPDLQPDAYGKRLAEIARAYTKNTLPAPKVLIFRDNGELDIGRTQAELTRLKGVGTDRDIAFYGGSSYETF